MHKEETFMKKALSAILALILLLGCVSGMALTAGAEAVVEEINLRPGRTVEVSNEEEFVKAYQALYAKNSEINMIRLQASLNAYKASLRTENAGDPWMSGYEGTLVVKLPEGTAIDLNGCMLSIRANHGYDDNGTGKPSGDVSFGKGKIFDSFVGGFVNLYTINEGKYIDRAFELARKYPEIVRMVSMSGVVADVADYEFTVPGNVCLKFSGTSSELTCKSVTFEPGATSVSGWPGENPCMRKTKKVVFQYVDDADAKREGVEWATETVKVDGSVPVFPAKTYKVNGENSLGGTEEAEKSYNLDAPVIANPSTATTEAAIIENPAGKVPALPSTYTKEDYYKMIQETALAYYYHNPDVQYDGLKVTASKSLERHMDDGAPEDAAVDSQVYSVCSNYCWKVYQEVFNHNLFRMSYGRTRTWADFDPATTPELVYQYSGPDAVNSKGETDINKALKESRKLLEVGDVVCYANKNSGHAMLFVGDIFGDGTDYILHCWGDSYDSSTGADKVEGEGSIVLQKADTALYTSTDSPNCYLALPGRSDLGFCILRPLWDPALPKIPTAEGAARLQYPGLNVWRELDRLKFDTTLPGEEIPVYLTIANKGRTTLDEVPVEEYIPEGTTLVEGSLSKGAKVEGNTIKWAVKLPAGTELTLTYKVKLNGELGDTINFESGKVGGLHSRATSLTLSGKGLTEEQGDALLEYAKKLVTDGATGDYMDLALFNKVYAEALGLDIGLPQTAEEYLGKFTKSTISSMGIKATLTPDEALMETMVMPLHFTGQYVEHKTNWERVRNYNADFYQAGDMVIGLYGLNDAKIYDTAELDLFMYLGDGRVLKYTHAGVELVTFGNSIGRGLKYNVFAALRPTLAYEDINERTVSKMTFNDVKNTDWFYTYVSSLVYEGTVNGMTATTFAPNGKLTYGQALKLVTLAVGEKEQAAVAGGHWASGYEKLAKEKGWLTETVSMDKEITRLQFCQIAAKAAGLTEGPAKNPFTDCSDAGVLALNNAGVINGMTKTTFEPNQPLTRAQISKIVWCLQEVA